HPLPRTALFRSLDPATVTENLQAALAGTDVANPRAWMTLLVRQPVRDVAGVLGDQCVLARVEVHLVQVEHGPIPLVPDDDDVVRIGADDTGDPGEAARSEEHTSELQSRVDLVCRLL